MNQLGRYPLLTAAEEVELAKRIERGDRAAKERMINSNLRLVVHIARRYMGHGVPLGDLDPGGRHRPQPRRREVRLAQGLQVLDLRDLVDPPGLPARDREPVEDDPHPGARRRAPQQAGPRAPAVRDRARPRADAGGAGRGRRHVARSTPRRRSRRSRPSVSLNTPVGDGDAELGELFADPESVDPEAAADDSLRGRAVRQALAKLPERERRIIELRFGFDGETMSLEAIGRELGITRERVRQLEREAFEHLAQRAGERRRAPTPTSSPTRPRTEQPRTRGAIR